jgi:hypothetical protein
MVTIAARRYDSARLLEDFRPVCMLSNLTLYFLIGYSHKTPILSIHRGRGQPGRLKNRVQLFLLYGLVPVRPARISIPYYLKYLHKNTSNCSSSYKRNNKNFTHLIIKYQKY